MRLPEPSLRPTPWAGTYPPVWRTVGLGRTERAACVEPAAAAATAASRTAMPTHRAEPPLALRAFERRVIPFLRSGTDTGVRGISAHSHTRRPAGVLSSVRSDRFDAWSAGRRVRSTPRTRMIGEAAAGTDSGRPSARSTRPGGGEPASRHLHVLGEHLHVRQHGHEVRVPGPALHDVHVHVVDHAGARDPAEVPAEVVPLRCVHLC